MGARMSVAVYSRLGDLLRNRNLSVGDLQQQIAMRFELAVDVRTLNRLAHTGRVRRPDLDVAAAVADILGVGLDDIFAVEATPVNGRGLGVDGSVLAGAEDDILDPDQNRRLDDLFEAQDWRTLTDDERRELRALVSEWGHRVNERALRDIAAQRGDPIEQVRAEVAADLDRALAWWAEVQADPARLGALIEEARERQRARVAG